jgi:oligoendopeptidase F
MAVSTYLFKNIDTHKENFIKLLCMGGNANPIDQLLAVGIDMRTPNIVNDLQAHLDNLVNSLVSQTA